MVNRTGKSDRLPKGVEVIAADAYDLENNVKITMDATTIYQCAQPEYYEWAEKFPPLQTAILETASRNGAKLVVGDNLYMYGHFKGILREESPIAANTRKGNVRAEMARAVQEAHEKGRVRAAVGRASDFFGPDDFDFTEYTILPLVQGKTANLVGRRDQPHSFTYLADFGRLLATLGTHDDAMGEVWFAPTNPPVTQDDFMQMLAAELGTPVKIRYGGPLMIRLLGLFNKEIAEVGEMMFAVDFSVCHRQQQS